MPFFRTPLLGAILSIVLVGCGASQPTRGANAPKADEGKRGSHGPAKGDAPDPGIQKGAKVSLATVVEEPPKTLDEELDAKLLQMIADNDKPQPEKAETPEEEDPPAAPKPKPKPKPKKKKPKAKK